VINTLSEEYATLALPYQDNPIVRAAIEAMRRNATKAVLQVGYVDSSGGFTDKPHPLLDIWTSPGPGETDGTILEHLYEGLIGSDGDGNAYCQFITDRDRETNGTIREIQPINPLWVQWPVMGRAIGEVLEYPISGADYARAYVYSIPADRMLHAKTGVSQMGRALGRTPLHAVKAELALIKLISIYETTVLSRSGVPSFIISLLGTGAQMLGQDQITTLKSDIKRAMSGKAVGDPFVTRGDMKIETPGFSPQQLSVAELAVMAVARVCGILGWTPMSLKQPDTGKTYSNLIEANKASWRDAVIPFLELVAANLTRAVRTLPFGYGSEVMQPDDRLVVRFDTSQIEELAADQDKAADRVTKLLNAGIVTLDEARAMIGLGDMEESDRPENRDDDQDTEEQEGSDDASDNGNDE
jgi:phage portal protein BeeE